jgi:hypothetical protein
MPDYRIREEGASVSIELTDVAGKHEKLLWAFGECQAGQCSCPTDQYEKVADMQLDSDAEQITIQLQPVEGERFDTKKIAACLDYTIAQTDRPTGE